MPLEQAKQKQQEGRESAAIHVFTTHCTYHRSTALSADDAHEALASRAPLFSLYYGMLSSVVDERPAFIELFPLASLLGRGISE